MNNDDQIKRILISLPQHLLNDIDEAAKQRLQSRTGYIRQILAQAIKKEDKSWEAAYQKGRQRRMNRYIDSLELHDLDDESQDAAA